MSSDPGMMNIHYETLAGAQTDLTAAYQAAYNAIQELEQRLNAGLSQWTGAARETYTEVQHEWNRAFAHMAQVLNQAGVHMGNAHDTYQAVERQNTSIWR
jgi:WXG100 family type VII secretion target